MIKALYSSWHGSEPASVSLLTAAGSNRKYYRLADADGSTVVGCVGTNAEENKAFITLCRHFHALGLPVPELLAVSDDGMCYLQEDLGSLSLFDALASGRAKGEYGDEDIKRLEEVMRQLPRLQYLGAQGIDWSVCYPQPSFDSRNVFFDLNYFKYCFLKLRGVEFNEIRLEDDFQRMASVLTQDEGQTFMYRDFQARNVMLDDKGKPCFIDFQGGRRGPIYYDVASFLWQASAHYPAALRQHLIDVYFAELQQYNTRITRETFDSHLSLFVLFRLLQVLGAYGYRGLWEKKKHFIDSIPSALDSLAEIVDTGFVDTYPEIKAVLLALFEQQRKTRQPKSSHLVVKVYSFSYKKGIPADDSGNGGGYVFDCRSSHNPGRYAPYKKITGLDKPVIDFLEADGEILTFLDSVYPLADAHVSRYIERGFTNLMFCFGCTGGQHRSVYSAQHVAEYINRKYGVEVHLCHREQGISTVLPYNDGVYSEYLPMQAMVFAAGLGTRLKPLTDTMPKALVRVGERPLLQHVIERLKSAGVTRTVVNVHHFADQIIDYLKTENNFYTDIRISDERDALLETGGGLRKAASMFLPSPVLIHNVDIFSNVDLRAFYLENKHHEATLLVSERKTARYLLFDDAMRLVGWTNIQTGEVRTPYTDLDVSKCRMYAFSGIHIIGHTLLSEMQSWRERFSIIDFYLDRCLDHDIRGCLKTDLRLLDVGKLDTIEQANEFIQTI